MDKGTQSFIQSRGSISSLIAALTRIDVCAALYKHMENDERSRNHVVLRNLPEYRYLWFGDYHLQRAMHAPGHSARVSGRPVFLKSMLAMKAGREK
eukprot:scaffold62906_cov18-Tisochrysis_lutea.AAC.3